MTPSRGAVVVATDPFKDDDDGRPFLVINRSETPFSGEQFIALSLTSRTWHDERIPLADEDWLDGGAPTSSSIMPWSVNSVKYEWVDYRQGSLQATVVHRAVSQLVDYLE